MGVINTAGASLAGAALALLDRLGPSSPRPPGPIALAIGACGAALAILLIVAPLVNLSTQSTAQSLLAQAEAVWHMDEAGGDRVADAKGRYDALAGNADVVEGPFGRARHFNGLSSFVRTPLTFDGAPGATVSLWVRTDERSPWAEGSQQEGLQVILDTGHDERNNFVVQSDASDLFSLYAHGAAAFELQEGIWTHLVAVVDRAARTRAVHLDGLKSSGLYTTDEPTFGSVPLVLGKWATGDARYFQGSMTEVTVWRRALSDAEVQKVYQSYPSIARATTIAYPPAAGHPAAATPLPAAPRPTARPAGPGPAPASLTGPKAVWHMDDPAGDALIDSADGNGATAHNTQVTDGPKDGNARLLNGGDSFIETPLSLQGAAGASVSLWLKPDPNQPSVPATVLDTGHDAKVNFVFHCVNAAMTCALHAADTDLAITLKPDVWAHILLVVDASNNRIAAYQDGRLAGEAKTNSPVQFTPSRLILGKWASGNTRYFKGALSEVAVWERVLSPDEITALFASRGN